MTVAEIKAKLPEAEVYTLASDCKYILVVGNNNVSAKTASVMSDIFRNDMHLDVMILRVNGEAKDAIQLLEIKP